MVRPAQESGKGEMVRHSIQTSFVFCLVSLVFSQCGEKGPVSVNLSSIDQKVDSVLALMTLEEKIGQMSLTSAPGEVTGPILADEDELRAIEQGLLGNLYNVLGAERIRMAQEIAVNNSRLRIPLSFSMDVIHGFRTVFPVPLGEAASWDLMAIGKSARIAATEAAASGINWTYAPMVDLCRDPRWGRIAEGAGEDKYLASLIARARVKGFQGNDPGSIRTIAATAKHYAGYGAARGGRDYNTVDVSKHFMHEYYLVPFKAAADEGVASIMLAFNEWNGIPATANEYLVREVLRESWQYPGITVSDWNSIGEMVVHGYAGDEKDAANKALQAGCDMELVSKTYRENLKDLVESGAVPVLLIDNAVRRILKLKFELGLFDDPYRYCDRKREDTTLLHPDHIAHARDMARKSIVLLKNEGPVLPLSKGLRRIAVIGPLAADKDAPLGSWRAAGSPDDVVSLLEGIRKKVSGRTRVVYSKGCEIEGRDGSGIPVAVSATRYADVIIAAVGEGTWMSGEAASRGFLDLPGRQQDLLEALVNTGKPVVVVLMNGRPLDLRWMDKNAAAILETWFSGVQAGNAIADVLFGDYNPTGRLPVSFPYAVGQIPVHYDRKSTGRPYDSTSRFWSRYIDMPNEALYPFGFGLSYSEVEYLNLEIDRDAMHMFDTLGVTLRVANKGKRATEETVQLYIHDELASLTRPDMELVAFKKSMIPAGDTVVLRFGITMRDLSYLHKDLVYRADPGSFQVFAGPNSRDLLEARFILY